MSRFGFERGLARRVINKRRAVTSPALKKSGGGGRVEVGRS